MFFFYLFLEVHFCSTVIFTPQIDLANVKYKQITTVWNSETTQIQQGKARII